MPKRLISLMLALVYFSAAIAFSAPHNHEDGKVVSHKCVACAWHIESTSDAPVDPVAISIPLLVVIHTPAPDIQAESSSPRAHRDRGPPVFS